MIAWKGNGEQYGTLSNVNYLATICTPRSDWSQNYDLSGQNNTANSGKTSNAGSHTHTIASTGKGQKHENRPPYEVAMRWKRIA